MVNMRKLYFHNPTFHEGVNVTIRKGLRWSKVKLHEVVEIPKVGEARILKTTVISVKELDEIILAYEYDPTCRDKGGIFKELSRIYPGITEDDIVTVLFFEIIG